MDEVVCNPMIECGNHSFREFEGITVSLDGKKTLMIFRATGLESVNMNGFYRKSGLAVSPHYFILQGFPWFGGNFCCCFTLSESKNLNSVMRKLRVKWDRQKCLHCNNSKDCYTLEGMKILNSDSGTIGASHHVTLRKLCLGLGFC